MRTLFRDALRALAVGSWLAAMALPSLATPIYNFTFKLFVDGVTGTYTGSCYPPEWGSFGFGCDAKEGDVWEGHFSIGVDPSTVADGGLSTPFLSMRIVTGEAIWDHCALKGTCVREAANDIEGYRDVVGPEYFNTDGPGFWVKDGKLIGFSAGIYGSSDSSFLDFDYTFAPGAGQFTALDRQGRVADGRYVIQQVPEPSPLGLALLALGLSIFSAGAKEPRTQRAERQAGI